jgi:hypothetical protein
MARVFVPTSKFSGARTCSTGDQLVNGCVPPPNTSSVAQRAHLALSKPCAFGGLGLTPQQMRVNAAERDMTHGNRT